MMTKLHKFHFKREKIKIYKRGKSDSANQQSALTLIDCTEDGQKLRNCKWLGSQSIARHPVQIL